MKRAAALLLLGATLLGLPRARGDRAMDPNRLTPASDSYGLVVSERAQLPAQWEVGAGCYAGYLHHPLTMPSGTLVTGQVTGDLVLSIGLFDFLALSTVLPLAAQGFNGALTGDLAAQPAGTLTAVTPTTTTGVYLGAPRTNVTLSGTGPRDPRLSLKGRLWRGRAVGVAVMAAFTVPVGDSASYLGDGGVTFRPTAVVDGALGRFSLVGNLGAVVRGSHALADPVTGMPAIGSGHELTWAAALAFRPVPAFAAALEGFGTVPLTGAIAGAPVSADADLLASAWFYPSPRLRVTTALGGGLNPGSPRRDPVRVLLGVSWSPTPRAGGLP